MRADRLLSLMMLLQTRGRMTAQALSEALEVSERTVYRDIEALSMAGVPVYAERGPGGGCALLDSYRTGLTGLTEDEVRALFMLSIPAPLAQLGVGQELRAALLKLTASLPDSRRHDDRRVRQRIHLDSTWWFQTKETTPFLHLIHRALWEDHRLRLTYRLPFDTPVERIVDPFGLVAKTSVWYLVYRQDTHMQVRRISDVLDAHILDETFVRPADFDLSGYWDDWCAQREASRAHYPVTLYVAADLIAYLHKRFGSRYRDMVEAQSPGPDGWMRLTLSFESFEDARMHVLSFGRAARVITPAPLRKSVRDFAVQIVETYGESGEKTGGE